ncbi:unnamed protein product [Thlaspi arvense]|uniref:non-specific serine/threonine protein kinase n=1 Tax=Thlaspi arvense TaxID=13288 RepID=A0AAU9S7S4_THLAR|nr:unnamed protein product [Thlaspi arvense]
MKNTCLEPNLVTLLVFMLINGLLGAEFGNGDPEDKKCVVKLLDHFEHPGPNGQHLCMVFDCLGDNLRTLMDSFDGRGLPIQIVKEICFHSLVGLDYLRRQLSIIHTDLKPENIVLLSMIDPTKDPKKSGASLILPNSKNKTIFGSSVTKDVKTSNGDLTKNQKKKIKRKAKKAAQGCVGRKLLEKLRKNPKHLVLLKLLIGQIQIHVPWKEN